MKDLTAAAEAPISRDSEYSLLMSSMDVSVSKHILDEHFTVVWANNRYYEMFGYTKGEYENLFHNQCDLFYQENPEDWADLVNYVTSEFSQGKTKYEYVCRMRHRDGRKLWIKLTGNRLDEYVDGYQVSYSVMMDITEQMQTKLEQTVTYNNFPGLISKFLIKPDGFYYMDANAKYSEVFQKNDRYLFEEMTPQSGLAALSEKYEAFRKGEFVSCSIFQDDIHGKRVYMNVSAECVDWIDNDPVYLLLHADISQLTKQNAELERLAYTDLITNGMNRIQFDRMATKAILEKPAGTYSLAWMNMRKFKLVNDLEGNKLGDTVLKYIHDIIKPHLRPGELLARIDADNYTILLETESNQRIEARLNEIVENINAFNNDRELKYFLSFTVGICLVSDPALEITQIQDRANIARKEIQTVGHDSLCACSFYNEQERTRLLEEQNIENRMQSALRGHEFVVYLQPKVALNSHTVAGAEALVRWDNPEQGLIPPNLFIPIFEKNGFILELDLYVLEEVCILLRSWIDKGVQATPISVNVSRAHFTLPNFVEQYAAVCKKHRVPTSLIELEVTETIIFQAPELFACAIKQMHSFGFTCSMDDFGSGYSSLNVLKDIEMDVLKLDRAFFGSIQMNNPREKSIITTVIDLAKKLKMKTVAEGVETKAQQEFLEGTDCDMIQGFVFSRPLPVPDYEQLVFDNVIGHKKLK